MGRLGREVRRRIGVADRRLRRSLLFGRTNGEDQELAFTELLFDGAAVQCEPEIGMREGSPDDIERRLRGGNPRRMRT